MKGVARVCGSGFAQERALAAPPIARAAIVDCFSLLSRGSLRPRRGGHPRRGAVEARLARSLRVGAVAAAAPVRFDRLCNPQDSFSTTSTFVSVHSGSHSHAIREPLHSRQRPASAIRSTARVISSARTPLGVPLAPLSLVLRADGTSPAPTYRTSREPIIGASRERSHPENRLRTPSTCPLLPLAVDVSRPVRVARSRAPWSRGIAQAKLRRLLQCQPTRRHLSRASGPRTVLSPLAESLLFRGARTSSA